MQKWAKVDEIKVEGGLIRANMMYHKGRGFESRHRFESTAASIYSSSSEGLQIQAHKAAITDSTKLINPIVITIKAKVYAV